MDGRRAGVVINKIVNHLCASTRNGNEGLTAVESMSTLRSRQATDGRSSDRYRDEWLDIDSQSGPQREGGHEARSGGY